MGAEVGVSAMVGVQSHTEDKWTIDEWHRVVPKPAEGRRSIRTLSWRRRWRLNYQAEWARRAFGLPCSLLQLP